MNVLRFAGYHMPLLVVELLEAVNSSHWLLSQVLLACSCVRLHRQCCCAMLWVVYSVETMDLFCGDDRLKI